ncbi:hypothetical protein H2204_011206, partial [Knufia peltigerae]
MPTRFAHTWLLKLFGGSQQTSWPEPAESTGHFLKQVEDVKYWTAKGPAVRAFEILSPDIVDHLSQFLDTISSRSVVEFYVFMRGDNPTTTYPVVMFTCEDSEPCRQAQKIIDESGLLDDFPGMKSDNAAYPPDSDCQFEQWASETVRQDNEDASCRSNSGSVSITGNTVSVNSVARAGTFVRKATIGGFVQHELDVYAYTAGHVFHQMMPPSDIRRSEVLQNPVNLSAVASQGVELSLSSVDLDYAFLRLPDPASAFQLNIRSDVHARQPTHVIRAPLKDVAIIVETTSAGTIKGTLSSTPAYTRLPHSKSFQKVFKGRFSQPLAKGDSGSWVIDESNHGLYGHVIGGGGRTAYIMPAHSVFEDAKQKLGGCINLPHNSHIGQADPRVRTEVQEDLFYEPVPRELPLMEVSEQVTEPSLQEIQQKSLLDKIEDYDAVDHPGHDKNNNDESESDGSSMISAFMRDDETPDYLVPHENIVEEFCNGASLHMLQSEQAPFLFKYGAWLGESGGGSFQSSPTWLTARGLYEALKPSRIRTQGRTALEKNADDSSIPKADKDIERRLIFVNDLDSWNIYALVGTATTHQVSALQDAFHGYLSSKNCIEVMLPAGSFRFSLHLPYYAWRTSPHPRRDARLDGSGRTLRQAMDVSLLEELLVRDCTADNSYLYEAQISCVIAGCDEWRWTAYCFVDSYFDSEDPGPSKPDPEMLSEVQSWGSPSRPPNRHEARYFFLKVLATRTEQICKEWGLVMSKLEQSSRSWFTRSSVRIEIEENEDAIQGLVCSMRQSLERLEAASSILLDLRNAMERTLQVYAEFLDQLTINFSTDVSGSLAEHMASPNSIRTSFTRLQRLEVRLKGLEGRCKAWEWQIRCKLTRHDMDAGELQRRLAEKSHRLSELGKRTSLTTMMYLPICFTAAIFSMEESVRPFTPSGTSLLATFIGACILLRVVYQVEVYLSHEKLPTQFQSLKTWWRGAWSWPAFAMRRRQLIPLYSRRNQGHDPEKDQYWLLEGSASG